ncbi:vWA domain-containing protein [Hyphobacterium sp.]|uniref:vWA domain-containing protein n=1 Tax=Hyphobacterium sp. TaxID=2004662 RepID=UPI003BA8BC0D
MIHGSWSTPAFSLDDTNGQPSTCPARSISLRNLPPEFLTLFEAQRELERAEAAYDARVDEVNELRRQHNRLATERSMVVLESSRFDYYRGRLDEAIAALIASDPQAGWDDIHRRTAMAEALNPPNQSYEVLTFRNRYRRLESWIRLRESRRDRIQELTTEMERLDRATDALLASGRPIAAAFDAAEEAHAAAEAAAGPLRASLDMALPAHVISVSAWDNHGRSVEHLWQDRLFDIERRRALVAYLIAGLDDAILEADQAIPIMSREVQEQTDRADAALQEVLTDIDIEFAVNGIALPAYDLIRDVMGAMELGVPPIVELANGAMKAYFEWQEVQGRYDVSGAVGQSGLLFSDLGEEERGFLESVTAESVRPYVDAALDRLAPRFRSQPGTPVAEQLAALREEGGRRWRFRQEVEAKVFALGRYRDAPQRRLADQFITHAENARSGIPASRNLNHLQHDWQILAPAAEETTKGVLNLILGAAVGSPTERNGDRFNVSRAALSQVGLAGAFPDDLPTGAARIANLELAQSLALSIIEEIGQEAVRAYVRSETVADLSIYMAEDMERVRLLNRLQQRGHLRRYWRALRTALHEYDDQLAAYDEDASIRDRVVNYDGMEDGSSLTGSINIEITFSAPVNISSIALGDVTYESGFQTRRDQDGHFVVSFGTDAADVFREEEGRASVRLVVNGDFPRDDNERYLDGDPVSRAWIEHYRSELLCDEVVVNWEDQAFIDEIPMSAQRYQTAIAIVLDTSGSMAEDSAGNEDPPPEQSRIYAAHQAVTRLLEEFVTERDELIMALEAAEDDETRASLEARIAAISDAEDLEERPDDLVSLVMFDGCVVQAGPFTRDYRALINRMHERGASGSTPLAAAIHDATNALLAVENAESRILYVLTDGDEQCAQAADVTRAISRARDLLTTAQCTMGC